jgi:hypothetical protein
MRAAKKNFKNPMRPGVIVYGKLSPSPLTHKHNNAPYYSVDAKKLGMA